MREGERCLPSLWGHGTRCLSGVEILAVVQGGRPSFSIRAADGVGADIGSDEGFCSVVAGGFPGTAHVIKPGHSVRTMTCKHDCGAGLEGEGHGPAVAAPLKQQLIGEGRNLEAPGAIPAFQLLILFFGVENICDLVSLVFGRECVPLGAALVLLFPASGT